MTESKRKLYSIIKEKIEEISLKLTSENDEWIGFREKLIIEENYEAVILCDDMIKLNKKTCSRIKLLLEIPPFEVEIITVHFKIEMKKYTTKFDEIKEAFNNLSLNI